MTTQRDENTMTLASLLGVGVTEAASLLDRTIDVRWDPADAGASLLAGHLCLLLSRTVTDVTANAPSLNPAAEVLIGEIPASRPGALRVVLTADEIRIGPDAPTGRVLEGPRVLALAAACYAAGMAIRAALGTVFRLPGRPVDSGLVVPVRSLLGMDSAWTRARVNIGRTHLAGAGAIGNAFLYALALFDVEGEIVVVDHDVISNGNLNRCLLFELEDVDQPKAVVLAQKASLDLPNVNLIPAPVTLAKLGETAGAEDPRWLRRLVVCVDSPRARRSLQTELPREVFDASTTGTLECVFHHHVQPTDSACLACIYHESADELAHERHIAQSLGVALVDVHQREVSNAAAQKIHLRYPDVAAQDLVGQSYDSLFKAFCGQGRLVADQAEQVLAPFAFVSALAGLYLAIEFVRRLARSGEAGDFNYWRLSAWMPPVEQLRSLRPRHPNCGFCGQAALLGAARRLWG